MERDFVHKATEATVRIALVALLVAWCFLIVRPFIVPVVWGIIIAVAVHPTYRRLESLFDGRRAIAAIFCTVLMLAVLVVPTVMLAGTVAESARRLAADLGGGSISIPAPPHDIAAWPVIGEPLDRFWRLASENLEEALGEIRPQIAAFGRWFLSTATGLGLGVLQFVVAIIIAGIFLAHAQEGGRAANAIATRFAGEKGKDYAALGQATVRSVARGILGVAFIQSLFAGLGFLAVGIPGAGLLALVCLLLAVVQIGPAIVLIGTVIYVFSTADTVTAVVFMIWSFFVGILDNILKPILLGRGVKVPMVVIFVGAIGGFLAYGIIGLFVGSVILALGFTLFKAWLG
ncbi:MAG: AI-2E family transporter [Rhodospirillales bacterium]|nr:AI-2E family transporter [Rhodospirillales bacterium]